MTESLFHCLILICFSVWLIGPKDRYFGTYVHKIASCYRFYHQQADLTKAIGTEERQRIKENRNEPHMN